MNESKISVRYAKALFELAKEKNILEQVNSDMKMLYEASKLPDFDDFLNSPIITISQKQKIFKGVFQNKINDVVLEMLLLMSKNRRESYLKMIALNYMKLYRQELGITEVELVTATEVIDEVREKITQMLAKIVSGKIDIKHTVKPEIIGGFIIRIDDKQIDASVRSQLRNIKKQLTN